MTGEEPGKELKEWSYSPQEIAEMLGITDCTVYDLIKKNNIETVIVDSWKRVPKDAFYKWYHSQNKYRTREDWERDAAIENATISMSEMARLLGVKRNTVYSILKNPQYKDEEENVMTIPDGVDAELLMKVLSNPEMTALLTSLAKTMK